MPRKPRRADHTEIVKRQRAYQFHQKKLEKDNMSYIHAFMVLGYFVSCFLILSYFPKAVIDFEGLLKLFCLIIALSFIVPIKLYRKWLTMSMYEYIFLNLLGISTLGCALFFVLNESFRGEPYEETYKIESIERVHKAFVFNLEDAAYDQEVYLRTIKDKEQFEKTGNKYLSLTFAEGLFGVRVIENKRLH